MVPGWSRARREPGCALSGHPGGVGLPLPPAAFPSEQPPPGLCGLSCLFHGGVFLFALGPQSASSVRAVIVRHLLPFSAYVECATACVCDRPCGQSGDWKGVKAKKRTVRPGTR